MNVITRLTGCSMLLSMLLVVSASVKSADTASTGIVHSVERAWVTADGDVSGEHALWKIVLDGSMDPAVPGRGLLAGQEIRVIFPPEYDLGNLDPGYPVADIPTPFPPPPASPLPPLPCLPTNFQCTTGVLLQGWPEHPFFPPVLFHVVSIDVAANAFVFTATQDILPAPPANPGIKELFVLLNGVRNPAPGHYRLRVEAQTGPGGSWESGSTLMHVLPASRPSINATAVFVKAQAGLLPDTPACGPGTLPPNPDNPVWQTTAVNEPAPFVWTFLVWGKNEQPMDDVQLEWSNADHARLVSGRKAVGQLYIDAPVGAEGYGIEVNPLGCSTYLPAAPVIAGTPGIGPQPTGRLDLRFHAGSVAGDYVTTITMNNGNTAQMRVVAQ